MTTATGASLGPDNTTAAAVNNAEAPKEQTFKNDLQRLQFEELNKMIVERNDLVGRANAANGDRQSLTEQVRENSTDPEIVRLREIIAQAVLDLDELVKPIVDKTIEENSGDVGALENQIKEVDGLVKAGISYYKKLHGDDAASFFTKQERLKGTQVRSGAGGRRIRGFHVTVTIDGDDVTFENFSSAAKHIGCETSVLQHEFFAKAETEDPNKAPDEVNFVMNIVEVDDDENETEKDAMVKVYRTDEEKAKRSAAADASDSAEADAAAATSDETASDEEVDLENLG